MTDVRPGDGTRLGAAWDGNGTNFAVYSSAAAYGGAVTLCLLGDGGEERLRMWEQHDIWRCYAPGVGPGQRYGFRASGPMNRDAGILFDESILLLDPYARAMTAPDPVQPRSLQSVVVDESFDWTGDVSPQRPWSDTMLFDVVYNHTAEGPAGDVPLCFRGLANDIYYRRDPNRPGSYIDTTGTFNSLDAGRPEVLRLVMDSLRYWVQEMHVDGFRFDLAAVLARQHGYVDRVSAFFDLLYQDPVLWRVKLIAEPWDVGAPDSYHVGGFPPGWTGDDRADNFGVEGPSDDPATIAARAQRRCNLLATMLLSQGVSMLLGDEIGRTQRGNNNAYFQDNAISWYDWELGDDQRALLAFTQRAIALQLAQPALRRRGFLTGSPETARCPTSAGSALTGPQ